jgi:hemerythrin
MGLAWTESLSVGNAIIDSDHKNLIVVLDRIGDAIETGDRVALSSVFELLEAYMSIHAQNEEIIAEAIHYSFAEDKLAQQQLLDEMRYMIRKLQTVYTSWPDNLLNMYSRYLAGWMTDHILKTNMNMKPVLQAYPYEFIPGLSSDACSIQTGIILPIKSYTEPRPPIW